jgi:ABC-type nitrate/sulfonate/bicarbonate transport system substrate-binding protein
MMSVTRRSFLGAGSGLAACVLSMSSRAAERPIIKITASRNAAAPIWNLSNISTKFGFDVEMSVLVTYAEQARAAQSGQTTAATCGIDTMATIADQGVGNLRYIAADQYGGQNLVMRTGVNPVRWSDLEGKTIGVVPGTWARVQFFIALKEGGADLTKVKFTNVSVGATAQEALRQGSVDGVVLFTPQCDQIVVSGIGHYPERLDIGSSSLGNANSGLLATTEFLADTSLAANFMKAYLHSMEEIRDPKLFKTLVMQVTGVSEAVAETSMRNQVFSEKIDVSAIAGAAKLGPEFGFTKTDTSNRVERLIDFGPLMSASGKSREELTGPPKEATAIVRR